MSALNADLAGVLWRQVVIHRISTGARDRYNVHADAEVGTDTVLAYFEPTAADESAGTDRERRDEALLVLMPGSGLTARDEVEVDGNRWQVSGEPRTFDGLFGGAPHHTEAKLVLLREGP